MIYAVVRSTAEFPDILGDLDRKAVMEVAGEDEYFLAHLFPFGNEEFPFVKEGGPSFFLIASGLKSTGSAVRNHKGNSGDNKKEVRVTGFH